MKKLRTIYFLFLIIMCVSGYFFGDTKGLLISESYITNIQENYETVKYVSDYCMTCSDENLVFEGSVVIFIIPVLLTLFRLNNKRFEIWEYLVSMFAFATQMIFWFFQINVGSVFDTVKITHNYLLFFWVLSFWISFIILHGLLLMHIRQHKLPFRDAF